MKWKAIAAAMTLSALLAACADVPAPDNGARALADGDTGSEAQATGDEYAAELGLVPHDYNEDMKLATTEEGITLDGNLLEGCENRRGVHVSMAILKSGTIYCYSWTNELDAWVTSQRLQGHVPTEGEIADREEELARD